MTKKKLDFRIDEFVVYPAHGVGKIVGVDEQEVAGITLELFVVAFEKDKMTLRVPTHKAIEVGMRPLATPDVVAHAMHRTDDQREQSYSERQLYEAALERLTREIAVVNGAEEVVAGQEITDVLMARIVPVIAS